MIKIKQRVKTWQSYEGKYEKSIFILFLVSFYSSVLLSIIAFIGCLIPIFNNNNATYWFAYLKFDEINMTQISGYFYMLVIWAGLTLILNITTIVLCLNDYGRFHSHIFYLAFACGFCFTIVLLFSLSAGLESDLLCTVSWKVSETNNGTVTAVSTNDVDYVYLGLLGVLWLSWSIYGVYDFYTARD